MVLSWEFSLPTQVVFGPGAVKELGARAAALGKRALLVGYAEAGDPATRYLQAERVLGESGLKVVPFLRAVPEPSTSLAEEGVALARRAAIDVVVGIGGGSVLDIAKSLAALALEDGAPADYAAGARQARQVTRSLPVVAVPTTAGTGSEVTSIAVLSRPEDQGIVRKLAMHGPGLRPAIALVDPDLTLGSPAELTATCAADALGHAIESCLSRQANPLSTLLAGRAVSLIYRHLRAAVADPNDPLPRQSLSLAALLAGAAFDSAGVVMTHALAQALSSLLHLPHAKAVAIATPHNLRFNLEACPEQYSALGHFCGLRADSVEQRAERFLEAICELLTDVGLPGQVRVLEEQRQDLADRLTQIALADARIPLLLNPRRIRPDDLRAVFLQILTADPMTACDATARADTAPGGPVRRAGPETRTTTGP